jgi:hypothetical protein
VAYTICNVYALGPAYTGVSLRAQLYDSANAAVGSAISAGFYERSGGKGIFTHTLSVPDSHVGWADVYVNGAPSVILATIPINPQELENTDVKTSTRMATFSYTAPPTVNDIDTQLSSTHGAGSWATATGFATPTNVSSVQTAITDAIAELPDTAAIVAAIKAAAITGGLSVEDVLRNLWSVVVGDSEADNGNDPTSIEYRDADGAIDVTHTLTATTRTVA